MNLFRSEETVMGWSQAAPGSVEGILPVETWAGMFSADLFTRRLDPDYLANMGRYARDLGATMTELGMTGPFFMRS